MKLNAIFGRSIKVATFALFWISMFTSCEKEQVVVDTPTDAIDTTEVIKVSVQFPFDAESQLIEVEVIDDLLIYQGDIIIDEATEPGEPVPVGSVRRFALWPDGIIPYEIRPGHPLETRIRAAIDEVNQLTNLKFIERTTEDDYVVIKEGNECWSHIGKRFFGLAQFIVLHTGCSKGNIMHELLHTAGLYHEHARHDRDEYVEIVWENIIEDKKHNFSKSNIFATDIEAYDYGSIMHYDPIDFCKDCSRPTIINKQPLPPGVSMGQRNALSPTDIATINRIYPGESIRQWTGLNVKGGDGWYVGDFDGDDRDDILRYVNNNGGAEVLLSSGGRFEAPTEWTGFGVQGGDGWYVGDFNGDGKDDILRYVNSNGGAEVFLSSGWRFEAPTEWTGFSVKGGDGWYIGDFDGNGMDDILRYVNNNGGAEVFLSSGWRFEAPTEWTGFSVKGGDGWYIGDFDGNGMDDVFRYVNNSGGAEVFLSSGWRFEAPTEWTGHGVRGGDGWYVGDYNGDGKDDIFRYVNSSGGAEVFLSSGWRFEAPTEWTGHGVRGGDGWYVGDYNGDGKDDIFRYVNNNGGAEVFLSSGHRFE